MKHQWVESILDQQNDWIDENYFQIIVPLAEERDYWPIIGYDIILPSSKISKKNSVLRDLGNLIKDWDPESKAMIIGTLHTHWPNIKNLSNERIIRIVLDSMDVSNKVGMFILDGIKEALSSTQSKLT